MAANCIPKNADKVLFAEDLVTYVMSHYTYIDNPPCTAEPYREFVYNGFNSATKIAVVLILCTRRRLYLDDTFLADSSTYMELEGAIFRKHFPDGFVANNFLPYCVDLTNLAMDFYEKGVRSSPYLAVLCIKTALEKFDVSNGGWETLNEIAKGRSYMEGAMNELLPKT